MLPRNYYIITLPRNGNYITSLIIGLMGSPNLWNHGLQLPRNYYFITLPRNGNYIPASLLTYGQPHSLVLWAIVASQLLLHLHLLHVELQAIHCLLFIIQPHYWNYGQPHSLELQGFQVVAQPPPYQVAMPPVALFISGMGKTSDEKKGKILRSLKPRFQSKYQL